MVSSLTQPIAPTSPTPDLPLATTKPAEQRVVFRHLSWENYQQILAALGNKRSSRLTYDRGTLEITMPSEIHENIVSFVDMFIRVLVGELGLKLKTMGSTTLERSDLQRSAEPDNCYYIQHQPQVAGKIVDLNTDPPPDLIVEIDITHTDIDKLNLYASIGVAEFWRYNGRILRIYQLRDNQYIEVENTSIFPLESLEIKGCFQKFLQDYQLDEIEAEKDLRAWVKQQKQG
jgi:Uma2 family endonuclease